MIDKSLDEVLGEFNPDAHESMELTKTITLWVPEAYKEKYEALQKKSSRQFSKNLRKLVIAAIDKTHSKAS